MTRAHHASDPVSQQPTDSHETVTAHDLSIGTPAVSKGKICCVCGTDVSEERRYKDTAGRYWCCDCAKEDSEKKHPATCPDCHQTMTLHDLVEFEGMHVCKNCYLKRQAAAKRAAARQAAIAEEMRLEELKKSRRLIGLAVAIVAVAAVFLIVYITR